MTDRALAVFDVCDTLYATNTTLAFLRFLGERHPAIAREVDRWTSRRSAFFYLGAVSHRLLRHDLARNALIGALKGIPRQELEAAGRLLAADHLPGLANAELHERLRRHLLNGDEVLLVSNSLDVVVAPIADSLGVPFRASELEYKDAICTGRLKRDLTARKAEAVSEFSGGMSRRLSVYTDNQSDADILAMADVKVIVLPPGRREWGEDGSAYIRL
jgi:phosphoserine phosphatase